MQWMQNLVSPPGTGCFFGGVPLDNYIWFNAGLQDSPCTQRQQTAKASALQQGLMFAWWM
jgi:hypothetical protein